MGLAVRDWRLIRAKKASRLRSLGWFGGGGPSPSSLSSQERKPLSSWGSSAPVCCCCQRQKLTRSGRNGPLAIASTRRKPASRRAWRRSTTRRTPPSTHAWTSRRAAAWTSCRRAALRLAVVRYQRRNRRRCVRCIVCEKTLWKHVHGTEATDREASQFDWEERNGFVFVRGEGREGGWWFTCSEGCDRRASSGRGQRTIGCAGCARALPRVSTHIQKAKR